MSRPTRPAVITPQELARIGEALYGTTQWQEALADDLEINPRSVRYYLTGERPIHVGIAADLLDLVEELKADLHTIAKPLRAAVKKGKAEEAKREAA